MLHPPKGNRRLLSPFILMRVFGHWPTTLSASTHTDFTVHCIWGGKYALLHLPFTGFGKSL